MESNQRSSSTGSDIACLLLHGFTSGPWEMEELANYIFSNGIYADCPLLPGHGTTPDQLASVKWIDWHACSRDRLVHLKEKYRKVFVCGQSMGGCLALHLAAHYHVDGIISLAAGTKIYDYRLRFLPLLKRLKRYVNKKPSDISQRHEDTIHRSYKVYPLSSVTQVLAFYKHLEEDLSDIKAPLIIFHSKNDHTISYENANFLFSSVSSLKKEIVTLCNSYHLLTMDVERHLIFERIESFIKSNIIKTSTF